MPTPSLVTSISSESTVTFSSSSLSNMDVSAESPLFISTTVSNVTLLNMNIANISTSYSPLHRSISARPGNVSIVGTYVKDSHNVLTGGLFPAMSRFSSFFMANTSILRCLTNTDATTEDNHSMSRTVLTASHTFINCTWTNVASTANGGAIHADDVGSLSLSSCTFRKCGCSHDTTNVYGGSVYFNGFAAHALIVNMTVFDQSTSLYRAGACAFWNASKLSVTHTNCTRNTAENAIPTLHVRFTPENSILSNLRFEDGFTAGSLGTSGAIDFDVILADITHSNILFNSNTAQAGGAILYSTTSGTPVINWFSCIFFNNTATAVRPIADDPANSCVAGNDLFFWRDTEEWNNTLAHPGAFTNCFSNSEDPKIVINTGSTHTHHTIRFSSGRLLSSVFRKPSLIVSVRTEASDQAGCGMNYFLPCKTLGYAMDKQLSSSTDKALVEAGLFAETTSFTANTNTITISSFGNENPIFDLSALTDTFMTITNGFNLDLKFLSFIVASQTVVRHIGTGIVMINSCSFLGGESGDTTVLDLISTTTGWLSVTKTHFSSLKVGTGALLRWETAGSVTLTDLFFINLETTQPAPFTITPAASLSLSGLCFEKCVGASFSDLFVEQTALSQISGIPASLSTSASPRASQKDGQELIQRPAYQISVDGSAGLDEPFCWMPTKKCRSVGRLVARLGSDFEGEILVAIGESVETGIVLDQTHNLVVTGVSGTDSIIQLETSANSLLIVPSTSTLSLVNLKLSLPSSQSSSPVISSSGSLSITLVTFALSSQHTDLSASIFSVMSGTTSLTSCNVDGNDKPIGSFISQIGGLIDVESSNFSNLKMKSSFVAGGGNMVMKGNSFSSLVDSTYSGSANVMRITIEAGQKLEITKTDAKSTEFVLCSSVGNGGALNIALLSSGTLTISHTSFMSCSSARNGGALFVDLSASTSTSTSFSSLSFGSGSDSNTADLGKKVFVKSTNLKTDAEGVLIGLKSILSGSLVTTAEKNEYFGNNTSPESLLFFWYPHIPSSGAVHVHNLGEDHANCGRFELACQSLSHSFTSLKATRTITLDSSLQVSSSLPTLTESLTIAALAGSPQTLTLASGVCFTVSSGTLSFSSLSIELAELSTTLFVVAGGSIAMDSTCTLVNPSSTTHTSSLFSLSSGTLKLDATSLDYSNKFVSSQPLFSQTGGSLALSGMSIESVTRSSGDGSVISSTISSGSLSIASCSILSCSATGNGGALNIALLSFGTLTISHTSFKSCSSARNGGALFVDLSASTSTSTSFSSLSFGSGSDSNTADLGKKVFVKSTNLKTDAEGVLIGLKSILSGSLVTTAEKNEYFGNNTSPESLLFFWYPHIPSSGAVHVHNLGQDHANCGRFELACQSLSHSFASLKSTRTVTLDSSLQVSSSLPTLTESLTIAALAGSPQTLTLASGVCFTVSSGTLRFESLILTLPVLSTSLFHLQGGSLVMDWTSTLWNPSSTTHTSSLFSLSSGTITLDTATLDFSSRFVSSHSLFSQTGGSLALSGMSIENMTRSSCAGSVISSTISSGSLSIASCSISSCICSSGNGGALNIALLSSGTLTISDTSFQSCSSAGNGGAIWIDASSSLGSHSLSLLSLSFGRNNDANSCGMDKSGRDVFVVGGRLGEIISKEKWKGTFETAPEWTLVGLDGTSGETVDLAAMLRQTVLSVGKEGNDEEGDGTIDTPFLTLHKGMEKGMDAGEEMIWIEIVESARIGKRIVMTGGARRTCRISGRGEGSKMMCSISDGSDKTEGQIVVCGHTLSIGGVEIQMKAGNGTVLVVRREGRVGLSNCVVSGERGQKTGLIRVVTEGEATMSEMTARDVWMGGKASMVEMAGGRVWMEVNAFSDVSVVGGAVLCGRVSGGMEVRKTSFSGCRGERFGSVVRVRAAGSSIVLSECTFRDCWSGVHFGEIETTMKKVGGGCVFVWMERKKGRKLESVDLSGTEFTNCILENTNPNMESTVSGRECVGGSGFLIVGGRGHRVDLSGMSVSDCVCRNVELLGKGGFSGGVVGWVEKPVQTDRRRMNVRGSEVGMVEIEK
ncbi:hypothetical protein BLNAU_8246 [Blattamonas nauphoetae]|uniref:Uncharacterized protein n=1 Tax=Blattamonas nauphoetae TaxID=2049346 RepID=A0ABQ9XZ58_9EUKA|nr:hypothetical protein BLNAU_8246 [Blattamonas nauphoetae]